MEENKELEIKEEEKEDKPHKEMDVFEQSITRKFRKKLWSKFVAGIKKYELIQPNDHICCCISGGKDSMVMARLFMQLEKYSDFPFKVTYLVMNPGYNEINLQVIKNNLKILGIPAVIENTDIFEIANSQTKSPCFLCAKMRRGALYNLAEKYGCNKIALGHHYDDVIETTLMNLLNSGSFQTMLPKLKSTNYGGMELIRPMYFIREKDIIAFRNYHNLEFIQCACRFTENCAVCDNGGGGSQRLATKYLIQKLQKDYNDQVEKNIFKAAENVTMDMIVGFKYKGKHYSYLDDYYKEEKDTTLSKIVDKDFVKNEKSCGAVIFRIKDNKLYYLIEKMNLGHYSLCKGHVENNETEVETAMREIKEETSLNVDIDINFRESIKYKPYKDKDVIKEVIFFVGYNKEDKQAIDLHDDEVNNIEFYELEDALNLLTFDSDKNVLKKADEYIKKNINKYLNKKI